MSSFVHEAVELFLDNPMSITYTRHIEWGLGFRV